MENEIIIEETGNVAVKALKAVGIIVLAAGAAGAIGYGIGTLVGRILLPKTNE